MILPVYYTVCSIQAQLVLKTLYRQIQTDDKKAKIQQTLWMSICRRVRASESVLALVYTRILAVSWIYDCLLIRPQRHIIISFFVGPLSGSTDWMAEEISIIILMRFFLWNILFSLIVSVRYSVVWASLRWGNVDLCGCHSSRRHRSNYCCYCSRHSLSIICTYSKVVPASC